jgi:hypothetical protein
MAITFPLTPPTSPGNAMIQWVPRTVVATAASPFSGAQQVYDWGGQWWEGRVMLPPMKDAAAGAWAAFFMSCNGMAGTFYLGDSIRKTPSGNISGTVLVDAGATALSTTLPIKGGTGAFAVGDWLQVGSTSSSRLKRVLKVNAGSVDVFPRTRTAYAEDTAITFTNPKGVFRLMEIPPWAYDSRRIERGMEFSFVEVVP